MRREFDERSEWDRRRRRKRERERGGDVITFFVNLILRLNGCLFLLLSSSSSFWYHQSVSMMLTAY
jgi:hypothetical protein